MAREQRSGERAKRGSGEIRINVHHFRRATGNVKLGELYREREQQSERRDGHGAANRSRSEQTQRKVQQDVRKQIRAAVVGLPSRQKIMKRGVEGPAVAKLEREKRHVNDDRGDSRGDRRKTRLEVLIYDWRVAFK